MPVQSCCSFNSRWKRAVIVGFSTETRGLWDLLWSRQWFPDLSQKDANFLSPWDLVIVEEVFSYRTRQEKPKQSTEYKCGTPVTDEELVEMATVGREVDWAGDPTWVKERILMLIQEVRRVPGVDLHLYYLQHKWPGYAAVVSYRMDLKTIEERVKNGFYRRIGAVVFDIKQIAINAANKTDSD